MPNMKDVRANPVAYRRFLLVGRTGSGKTSQIWTLPGKKFAYIFDPNSEVTLSGLDIEYEFFRPDIAEFDPTFKGFNKDSKSDRPKNRIEPKTYNDWAHDIEAKRAANYFDQFDWVIFDSLTHLASAMFDRVMYLNGRYGDIPDRSDYMVIGLKITDMFARLASMPFNMLATGHVNTYQDDKTGKIETQLALPGSARQKVPLVFSDILQCDVGANGNYILRTKPDPRGLKDIRTTLPGLAPEEDVTIPRFDSTAVNYGLGRLLKKVS